MSISGISFDLDGTLIDSAKNLMVSWSQVMKEHGVNVNPDDIRPYVGLSPKIIVSKFIKDPSDEFIEALKARRKEIFIKNIDLVKVFDDALYALKWLKENGYRASIATSMGGDMINEIVKRFGLDNYVCCWISAEEVKNPKPAPDVFIKSFERMGIKPSQALVVGDREYDIIGGKAAGAKTVLVKRDEYSLCKTVAPDFAVNSLYELPGILKEL